MKSGYTEGKPLQSSLSGIGGMAFFGLVIIFGSWVVGIVLKLSGLL